MYLHPDGLDELQYFAIDLILSEGFQDNGHVVDHRRKDRFLEASLELARRLGMTVEVITIEESNKGDLWDALHARERWGCQYYTHRDDHGVPNISSTD